MKQLNWYQIFGKSNIPDGRTVLPTDDIQIWLNCADIWDKSYTTLYEVLNDTATLSALMASDNAVDYLVRSTSWAVPASVPTMTSNTTPSGVCIANSQYDAGHAAYKAFDSETAVCHETAGNASISSYYLGYVFPDAVAINRVKLNATSYNASYYYTVAVYGGTSLDNFVKLSDNIKIQGGPTSSDYEAWFANDTKYTTYVLKIEESNASTTHAVGSYGLLVFMANFYSASVTTSADAMTYIGQNNYCANTLLADATWCKALANSEYAKSVFNIYVPIMTDNTHPSGVASASSIYAGDVSNYGAWRAFDGNDVGGTPLASTQQASHGWLQYQFTEPVIIKAVHYKGQDSLWSSRNPSGYLQGSNDGANYDNIKAVNYRSAQVVNDAIENTNSYNRYRFYNSSSSSEYLTAATIQFYGRKDV